MSDGIDMEYTLDERVIGDQPPLRAGEIYAQYDARRAEFVRDSQGLTLATLADMVLGEDAPDHSDDALIRAVGMLVRERDALVTEREELLAHVEYLVRAGQQVEAERDTVKQSRARLVCLLREYGVK